VCFCSLKSETNCKKKARISWGYWFKKTLYYQVALLYMLARLITNVSQVGIWSHVQSESFCFLIGFKMHMACSIISFVLSRFLDKVPSSMRFYLFEHYS
jgi:hypothetical protein